MRLAVLVNEFPALTEPYVAEEVHRLVDRGHQVVVVSAFRPGRAGPEIGRRGLPDLPGSVEILYLEPVSPVSLLAAGFAALRRLGELRSVLGRVLLEGDESPRARIKGLKHVLLGVYSARLLAGYRIDHIHAHHGYFAAFAALVAARLLGVGYTLTLHGSDLLLDGLFLDAKVGAAERTFTISEFNGALLRERYGLPSERVGLRRLGVEPRGNGGRPGAPRVLLAPGRLTRVKNQQLLIRALGELKGRGRDVVALIVGGGEDDAALRGLARQEGVSDEAIFLGWLPRGQLLTLYRLADICVLSSLSEGLPLVLMEAMAHGAVAVAPEITGIPELIQDGRNGFLYPVGDGRGLVAVLERVLDSPPERLEAVRAAALETIGRDYDARTNTERFIERLTTIIEQGGVSGRANPLL